MWRAAYRNIVAHRLRLALTTLTVALGIAFVAGTNIFTDSLQSSFDSLVAQPRPDVTVSPRTELDQPGDGGTAIDGSALTLPQGLVNELADIPAAEAAYGRVTSDRAYVLDANGDILGPDGPPARVTSWVGIDEASPLRITEGAPPVGPDQVAVLVATAEEGGFSVGDEISIATDNAGVVSPTISGLVSRTLSGGLGGTLVVFDFDTTQQYYLAPDLVNSIGVMAAPGVSQDALASAITGVLETKDLGPISVQTGQESADEASERIEEGFRFLNTFLLAFGFLALFVATFLIVNTFTMLIAQRTRELALLRAIGASRRQVFGSVLLEAALIGALASVIGLAGGVLVSYGLRALVDRIGATLPAAPLVIENSTLILAAVVGIGVTVLSALGPAKRAATIAPVAAMRSDSAPSSRSLRRSFVIGISFIALAIPFAIASLNISADETQQRAGVLGASAVLAIIGTVLITPTLADLLFGWIRGAYRTSGVSKLAVENARRNPRRTSATASALSIGLALMTAVTVIGTSARTSIGTVIEQTIGADFVITNSAFRPLEPKVYQSVKDVPGADVVTYIRTVPLEVGEERFTLTGVETEYISDVIDVQVTAGSLEDLALGTALVDSETATTLGVGPGDTVAATFVNGPGSLRIVGIYEPIGFLQGFFATMPTVMSIGALERDTGVYITASDESQVEALRAELNRRIDGIPEAQVQDQADIKREINQQFDVLFIFVYALLGLSILVAFLGIVNTLSLSVYERFREIGLLRAVGMTRRQIRRMISTEALWIAVLGTLLGTTIGLIYGTLFQRILATEGITYLDIPWLQIGFFIIAGSAGGLVASIWPAWRASRMRILSAISTE